MTNRECYACSTKYHFCPSCPSDTKKESFYNMFCCERCMKIFKTLSDETFGHLTTQQCKERLIELGVKPNESFKDNIRKHIERVMLYEVPNDNKSSIVKEPENREEPKEEAVIEHITKKTNTKRKNKYRSNNNRNSEVDLNSK